MEETHTRDNADAVPHAVPLTFVPKISGVQLPLSENRRLSTRQKLTHITPPTSS